MDGYNWAYAHCSPVSNASLDQEADTDSNTQGSSSMTSYKGVQYQGIDEVERFIEQRNRRTITDCVTQEPRQTDPWEKAGFLPLPKTQPLLYPTRNELKNDTVQKPNSDVPNPSGSQSYYQTTNTKDEEFRTTPVRNPTFGVANPPVGQVHYPMSHFEGNEMKEVNTGRSFVYYQLTNIKGNELKHIQLFSGHVHSRFQHDELNMILNQSGARVSFQVIARGILLIEANFEIANIICINGTYKRKGSFIRVRPGALIGFGRNYKQEPKDERSSRIEFVYQKLTN